MQDDGQKHSFSNQELVAAFIEKRLSDNLRAFKEYLPEVYEKFSNYKEERFFLIYDQNGDINLLDREEQKLLFQGNAVQKCLDNLERYRKEPVQRPFFVASNRVKKTHVEVVNYIHSDTLRRIGDHQLSLLEAVYADVEEYKAAGKKNWFEIHKNAGAELPKDINTLVLFSTGLGFDLEKLYLEGDIKHLLLIEPSLDVFYASLQLIDWVSILEKSKCNGQKLVLILEEDREKIYSYVSYHTVSMGRHNMAGAYLYSAFYLESYRDMFAEIKGLINQSYLSGFGFYDDSRYSISHTLGNIKNNVPFMASNRKLNKVLGQEKLPVFLIGNGPSLDNDIDFLKNNQGKALIVSCGTALRALLKNDIQPDVHVELERTAHIPYWIKKSSDGVEDFFDKLKNITLIVASQVHPGVSELFGRTGMVLKDSEAGSFLVNYALPGKGIAILPRLAPTCLHTALTTMVVVGFRQLYLFGTDMGTLDPNVHHSKDSAYTNLKKEFDEKLKFKKSDEVYPSNFDNKEVYSSGFYPTFKRELENIIDGWSRSFKGDVQFYNCSDGALIKGANPCRADTVVLESNVDKKDCFDGVFEAFFSFQPRPHFKELHDKLDIIKDRVDSVCDYAPSLISSVGSVQDVFSLVDSFSSHFHSKDVLDDDFAWLYTMFDGSLLYILSCINSTAMQPFSRELVLETVNKQLLELEEFFALLKKDFRENAEVFDKEERYSMFLDVQNAEQ